MSASARQSSGVPALGNEADSGDEQNPPPVSKNASRTQAVDVEGVVAANEATAGDSDASERNNLISRTVNELYLLLGKSHDPREDLIAKGVKFHTLNSLIELGMNDKPDQQARVMETAVAASKEAHGTAAVTSEALAESIESIVASERDVAHLRRMAKQQGVHMQALNHLTQLMRLNPGDRGEAAINTLVAYADASGVNLGRVQGILAQYPDESQSVLPQIEPEPIAGRRQKIGLVLRDLSIGVVLTLIVMWMVL